ncbi:hypothetical protein [Sphingobacterium paucimobilis]|uniref:Uncharacterized protein n=1 Tax=Sphingobacterium paucimobilis HER1398 TaxID=1346330 RepID=U2J715_9SPHI|nr:hypothetical protein [Sphingobacterium paucimobilis]ERJ60714.1 hypothetical protein M472_18305 [Sphingobacterium paucimobilis HER1398]
MKLTPLNIALACVLVWVVSEWGSEQEQIMSWAWLLALTIFLALIDLGFRLFFKDLKRIWILQIGFILLVGILMVILKIQ